MPTQSKRRARIPMRMIIVRSNIPISLEIRFMIMKLAKFSKLKVSPRSSVMRFQGAKKERASCDSEKKLTINQKRFDQICKISRKALV